MLHIGSRILSVTRNCGVCMRIEVRHPAFKRQHLSVETASSVFSGPKLLLNGEAGCLFDEIGLATGSPRSDQLSERRRERQSRKVWVVPRQAMEGEARDRRTGMAWCARLECRAGLSAARRCGLTKINWRLQAVRGRLCHPCYAVDCTQVSSGALTRATASLTAFCKQACPSFLLQAAALSRRTPALLAGPRAEQDSAASGAGWTPRRSERA